MIKISVRYQELDGCAMSTSISSSVSQIIMEVLEVILKNNLNFLIQIFKRNTHDFVTTISWDKVY